MVPIGVIFNSLASKTLLVPRNTFGTVLWNAATTCFAIQNYNDGGYQNQKLKMVDHSVVELFRIAELIQVLPVNDARLQPRLHLF